MHLSITPPRRYDPEILEHPSVDDDTIHQSISDVARSNTWFQGARAVVATLTPYFATLGPTATLLDVGTGVGDIPRKAARAAETNGVSLHTIGLDGELVLARAARSQVSHAICGNALELPFADRSVDIVTCSQLLHHFRDAEATALIREMNRVARVAVIVSDIRRSWLAAAGFWAASFPLRFHPVTRHDGVVSVMRGFIPAELSDTIRQAIGITPPVRRRLGFRVTTSWTPVPDHSSPSHL